MAFWDKKRECMARREIEQLQLERLQATLNRVYKNVRHYRATFREIDFMPEDLRTLSDFNVLPFTGRQVLVDNYPYGMFAVPLREVVRLHTPALNIDEPVVMGYTRNDLEHWSELTARNLAGVGVTKDDVVQISLTFGSVTAPFGIQLGAERIGASVIPVSSGRLPAQVQILRDFRTTTLVASPAFALGLARAMEAQGIDPNGLSLKAGIFGGEPWSRRTRADIEARLGIIATDAYGMTEVFGPGAAWECPEKNGLHVAEDHFLPEVIDPVTMAPKGPGEEGELVLTTLTREAFPLIRYRTGDITRIDYAPCGCGRTHCRIERLLRRCDDVLVMHGTRIIPEGIGRVLARADGPEPVYQIVADRVEDQDRLTILVEISDRFFFDQMKKQRRFVEDLHREISEFLGWEVGVKLVEPGAFDRTVRVVDRREGDGRRGGTAPPSDA